MKKIIHTIAFVFLYLALNAQPIPPGGYDHGGGGAQVPGGNSPVGDGVVVLVILSLIWGCWKYYLLNMHKVREKEKLVF